MPIHAKRSKEEEAYLLKVGNRIRVLRTDRGLSQEAFALKCTLDRTYISDVERGERNLSLINLRKIAMSLGTTPSELLS